MNVGLVQGVDWWHVWCIIFTSTVSILKRLNTINKGDKVPFLLTSKGCAKGAIRVVYYTSNFSWSSKISYLISNKQDKLVVNNNNFCVI
jgi:hypothetical protein